VRQKKDDDEENLLASFANLDVSTYALLETPEVIPQPAVYSTKTYEVEAAHQCGEFVVQTEYPYHKFLVFENVTNFFHYSQSLPEEQ
jgi:hypothetical protein